MARATLARNTYDGDVFDDAFEGVINRGVVVCGGDASHADDVGNGEGNGVVSGDAGVGGRCAGSVSSYVEDHGDGGVVFLTRVAV